MHQQLIELVNAEMQQALDDRATADALREELQRMKGKKR